MTKENIEDYLKRTRANNTTLENINRVMGTDFTDPEIAEVFFEEWAEKQACIKK